MLTMVLDRGEPVFSETRQERIAAGRCLVVLLEDGFLDAARPAMSQKLSF